MPPPVTSPQPAKAPGPAAPITMPYLRWSVRVDKWLWDYTFTRTNKVTWRDPFNKMTGAGTWQVKDGTLITRWVNSKTWEEWSWPPDPAGASGLCHMGGVTYYLSAVATDFYLYPGDVVWTGMTVVGTNGKVQATIVYADEVRTGGTIAWLCRNPGAIMNGDRKAHNLGAFKDKVFPVPGVGEFAIFPDEGVGQTAVVKALRNKGPVTLLKAMEKYAPKGHGNNDPEKYAETVAAKMRRHVRNFSVDTRLDTLSDEQMMMLSYCIHGVESGEQSEKDVAKAKGLRRAWQRDDPDLPEDIRKRLPKT